MHYEIPLFPLPGLVLFPRTHIKLHIFEGRYRLMMDHVLRHEEQLALVQYREGYDSDDHHTPRVHRVATTARLLWGDQMPDGRWNICVEGAERVSIEKEIQETPFRIARVRPLVDQLSPDRMGETRTLMREVAANAERLAARLPFPPRGMINVVNTWMHPGVVADVIASAFVTDPYDRQSILNETGVLRRLKLVSIQVQRLEQVFAAQQGIHPDLPKPE